MSKQNFSLDSDEIRSQATEFEAAGDLEAAKEIWIQVWQLSPGDRDALAAIERLAVEISTQRLNSKLAISQQECQQLKQRLKALEVLEREQTILVEQLLSVGCALSSTCDLQQLLHLILTESREITCSDAGSIYLIDRTDRISTVCFEISQNDSQPDRSLKSFAVPMSQESLVGYVALTGEVLNLPDAHNLPAGTTYSHHQTFDRDIDYWTRSVLALPIRNPKGTIVGVIQLINRKFDRNLVVTQENVGSVTQPYSDWDQRVLQSFASQAAISIERSQLLSQLETSTGLNLS